MGIRNAIPLHGIAMVFAALFIVVPFTTASAIEKWGGHIELSGRAQDANTLGMVDFFYPISQDVNSLFYFNGIGKLYEQGSNEYNLGLGYRVMYGDWIVGGWGAFDRRVTDHENTFLQGSLGFEALSTTVDLRINAYIPESTRGRASGMDDVALSGNAIAVRLGEERALPGMDVELGYKLPILEDLRLYVGGFYFNASDFESVSGPRGRLEWRLHDLPFLGEGSRLIVGAEVRHDKVRDTDYFASLGVRIPFSIFSNSKRKTLSPLERRMTDPIVRDIDIVSNTRLSADPVPAMTAYLNEIENVVTLTANDNGQLHNRVVDAGENALVIVDGQVENTESVTLQSGQMLAGTGEAFTVYYREPNGGYGEISLGMPGGEGVPSMLTGLGSSDSVITTTDQNIISGLTVTGGGHGIAGAGSGLILRNSIIRDVGARGLYFTTDSNLRVQDVRIENTGDDGIQVSNTRLMLFDSQLSNLGGAGVAVYNDSEVVMENVQITDPTEKGIYADGSTVYFTNSVVSRAGEQGIDVRNGAELVVAYSQITDPTETGIYVDDSTAHLSNSVVSGVSGTNIGIDVRKDSYLFMMESRIEDIGGRAIRITDGDAEIFDSTIDNARGSQGAISLQRGSLVIARSIIKDPAAGGIQIYSGGSSLTVNEVEFVGLQGPAFTVPAGGTAPHTLDGAGNRVTDPPATVCSVGAGNLGSIGLDDFDGQGNPGDCP